MKIEEAIAILENSGWWGVFIPITTIEGRSDEDKLHQAIDMAISVLRSVSREQVEKVWRGEWIIGEPDGLGVPIHCNRCDWGSNHADQKKWMEYQGHIFCGHCGAPMSDEAVQMVMERLEAPKDGNTTD